MVLLVKPLEGVHEYVVGIDFGHGETSAAICPLEWGVDAGKRESNAEDIDMDISARKKVIPSAICRMADGKLIIGDEVFEHMTDNNGIRLAFKQRPTSLEGEQELLMVDYMKAIYNRIRESRSELTDTNHIVYIARPSGWIDQQSKDLYSQMALNAGIPLGGLTSESRAAIFYAKSQVNFANEISRGAIVFDLGSSTLDFTYLSDDNQPVDYGYNLGASIIDETILVKMILSNEEVAEFLQKYPLYRDALKFKARKFKEEAYSRNEMSKTIGGFPLGNVIPDEEESYEDYADTFIKLRINNLAELNQMVEEHAHYMAHLREALEDFRDSKIPGRPVNGVFLTGGASRMNFIRPIIAEVFSLPIDNVKIDSDNPSLTISRGIALLGTTDAITSILVDDLKRQLPTIINAETKIDKLIDNLASNISNKAWAEVESTCRQWVKNGKTTDETEMQELLKKHIEAFKNNKVSPIVNSTIHQFMNKGSDDVRRKMNEIISRYAPGREIKLTGRVDINDIDAINDSLGDMSAAISEICDSITNVVKDVLWAALGLFLWGVFAIGYYVIKGVINIFRDDADKRQDKADKLLEKKDSICLEVKSKIQMRLRSSEAFKKNVSEALGSYFAEQMEINLQQVTIPIE